MNELRGELATAIDEVLAGSSATDEFKRRLRKLIENAVSDNITDGDIADVLSLAPKSSVGGD